MDGITIRPARADDMDRIIAIMYDDPPADVRALTTTLDEARRIGALTIRNGLEIDPRRTLLAVADSDVVGLLERQRPGDSTDISLVAMLRVIAGGVRIAGFGALIKYARHQRARSRVRIDHPKDAYYIGELDVHPEWRNRGIGAQLIAYGEQEARNEGFTEMALSTTIINPAQHLYKRAGFRVVETRRDSAYERLTGIPGRVLMVKALT